MSNGLLAGLRSRLAGTIILTGAAWIAGMTGPAGLLADPPKMPDQGITILDGTNSFFRFMTAKRPAVYVADNGDAERTLIGGKKKIDAKAANEITPELPAKWTAADFDDSAWPRTIIPRLGGMAFLDGRGETRGTTHSLLEMGVLAARGKFNVTDPAAALKLTVKYRGGVVVYVNGQEVARASLPEGEIVPGTPGEAYPTDAFTDAAGRPLDWRSARDENSRLQAARDRVLGPVQLPAKALRKGVNVLAIEVHRSDYDPRISTKEGMWTTGGLMDVRLAAQGSGIEPNCHRPAGVQVWNQDCNDRTSATDYGDPNEKLQPIILTGARNGIFGGKVVVSSVQAIEGLAAVAGELKAAGGKGTIPASAVEVRYADPFDPHAEWSEPLCPTAPAKVAPMGGGGAVESVWVLVHVPADAPAGDYAGTLAVSAGGTKLADVPVKLHVADWKLPDPKDFQTFVGVYSSPITLALKYKAPLWSEEHWQLVEQSVKLLGQLGNKMVQLPVIDQAYLTTDSAMVTFVKKEDGSLEPDFSIAQRYLKLVRKHIGSPKFVVVYVYYTKGWHAAGAKQTDVTVTVLDKKTGKTEHVQVPELGTEEAKKFWGPVLLGLKERLAKEGMEKSLCLGCLTDVGIPTRPESKTFTDILGKDVQWQRQGHGAGGDLRQPESVPGGEPIVAHFFTYLPPLPDPKTTTASVTKVYWPRLGYYRIAYQQCPVMCLREFPAWARFLGLPGFGLLGLDYWKVPGPHRSDAYPGELSPSAITWAGPKGAEPLTGFQALREGLQEMEALCVISEGLDKNGAALGPELAGRCQAALTDALSYAIDRPSCAWWLAYYQMNHYGWQELSQRVFTLAGEVAAKTPGK